MLRARALKGFEERGLAGRDHPSIMGCFQLLTPVCFFSHSLSHCLLILSFLHHRREDYLGSCLSCSPTLSPSVVIRTACSHGGGNATRGYTDTVYPAQQFSRADEYSFF
jgi:hypothetical protein